MSFKLTCSLTYMNNYRDCGPWSRPCTFKSTLFILDTNIQVLEPIVKTKMKCRMRRHFNRICTICLFTISGTEINHFIESLTGNPLNYKMDNAMIIVSVSMVYSIRLKWVMCPSVCILVYICRLCTPARYLKAFLIAEVIYLYDPIPNARLAKIEPGPRLLVHVYLSHCRENRTRVNILAIAFSALNEVDKRIYLPQIVIFTEVARPP